MKVAKGLWEVPVVIPQSAFGAFSPTGVPFLHFAFVKLCIREIIFPGISTSSDVFENFQPTQRSIN